MKSRAVPTPTCINGSVYFMTKVFRAGTRSGKSTVTVPFAWAIKMLRRYQLTPGELHALIRHADAAEHGRHSRLEIGPAIQRYIEQLLALTS